MCPVRPPTAAIDAAAALVGRGAARHPRPPRRGRRRRRAGRGQRGGVPGPSRRPRRRAAWPASAEVSVKLSAIGQALDGPDHGERIALENARSICAAARNAGTTVTLDMEDHTTTDSTLAILRELRKDFPETGAVLQAYLHRTEADCRALAYEGSRVRLCKGAYRSPDVAYQPGGRGPLVRPVPQGAAGGQGYPMIATHDPRMIEIASSLASRYGRAQGTYEFQMLYGVRPEEQRRLAESGETVRVYVPYGQRVVRLPHAAAGRAAAEPVVLPQVPDLQEVSACMSQPAKPQHTGNRDHRRRGDGRDPAVRAGPRRSPRRQPDGGREAGRAGRRSSISGTASPSSPTSRPPARPTRSPWSSSPRTWPTCSSEIAPELRPGQLHGLAGRRHHHRRSSSRGCPRGSPWYGSCPTRQRSSTRAWPRSRPAPTATSPIWRRPSR